MSQEYRTQVLPSLEQLPALLGDYDRPTDKPTDRPDIFLWIIKDTKSQTLNVKNKWLTEWSEGLGGCWLCSVAFGVIYFQINDNSKPSFWLSFHFIC